MFHLQQKSFLKLLDLSSEDITGLLDLAAELKAQKKAGIPAGSRLIPQRIRL